MIRPAKRGDQLRTYPKKRGGIILVECLVGRPRTRVVVFPGTRLNFTGGIFYGPGRKPRECPPQVVEVEDNGLLYLEKSKIEIPGSELVSGQPIVVVSTPWVLRGLKIAYHAALSWGTTLRRWIQDR